MGKVIEFLSGKKTYLVSGAALMLAGLYQFNIIDKETHDMLLGLLAPLGVMALRVALKSEAKK